MTVTIDIHYLFGSPAASKVFSTCFQFDSGGPLIFQINWIAVQISIISAGYWGNATCPYCNYMRSQGTCIGKCKHFLYWELVAYPTNYRWWHKKRFFYITCSPEATTNLPLFRQKNCSPEWATVWLREGCLICNLWHIHGFSPSIAWCTVWRKL